MGISHDVSVQGGVIMKRPIVVCLLSALMLLTGNLLTLTHAQSPATDLKPTFISPTPGLYVNGWPAFTVTYPKEWVVLPETPGDLYRVGGTRPGLPPGAHMPALGVGLTVTPLPLEDWAKLFMPYMEISLGDIKVLSDKPSQLKDGTPAREIEVEAVPKYGPTGDKVTDAPKLMLYYLATKRKGDVVTWVTVHIVDEKARFEEDLKKIAFTLTFLPGREKPIEVPPDVRTFLDMFFADILSHDVTTIMAHFSDRYLQSGGNKAFQERDYRAHPEMFPPPGRTFEPVVTIYEPHGDRAYVDGFVLMRAKDGTVQARAPMYIRQIIKEQGQWRWFGNQK
jgi:hypothetical protein